MQELIKNNPMIKEYEAKLKKQEKMIKKLEKQYLPKPSAPQASKSSIVCYIYVEKKPERKNYKYTDQNLIQRDSTETGVYKTVKKFNLIMSDSDITTYEVNRLYNDRDDGIELIDNFLEKVKATGEDNADVINKINISDTITAFKITNKTPFNHTYQEPIFNEQLMEADATNQAITNKYTSYKINLQSSSFKDLIQFEHCEYVQNNFRPSSCFLTAIINKFYPYFNKRDSKGVRYHKELTYSYLCEILCIPDKESHNGVNYNLVRDKFFKRFKFAGIYAYDVSMNLREKHEPVDKVHSISLRVLLHNGHVYELTDNIKSLEQKVNYDDDERHTLVVSNKYRILEKKGESVEVFCYELSEIHDAIKANALNEDIIQLKIIVAIDMKTVLFALMDAGYTAPKINVSATSLSKITLKLNKLAIHILPACNSECEGQLVRLYSLEEYKAYSGAFDKFYKSIVKKEYLSDTHPTVQVIEDTYKITPLMGYFNGAYTNKPIDALDERRAYTECIQSIKNVPVFNYFDVYKTYNNEEIEDFTYYIIEILEITKEATILFDSKYTRTYGYILKQINIKFKIIYYRQPLNVEDVNFSSALEELYKDNTISDECKKAIANISIGLLGKKTNKAELSKIFLDYNEANYYAIKYDGKIIPLHDDDMLSKHIRTDKNANKLVYVVQIDERKTLVNGFMPINDMIYINQRMKLLKLYQKMQKLNIKMVGIKTDCILYEGNNDDIIKQNFKVIEKVESKEDIGKYKIDHRKYTVNKPIQIISNELIPIHNFGGIIPKIFTDELDVVAINKYVADIKQPLLIKGNYPGVGKSTLCKNYDAKCLFVCPYNKLCQMSRIDGMDSITFSKLFGLVGSDQEMMHIKEYDISEYKTIVFDEIFLYEPTRLKRVAELMAKHSEKLFMGTGDADQREAIGFKNADYITHCMSILFPNQILLNDIKRFKNQSDKDKLILLKHDILNTSMSVKDVCIKHGLKMKTQMKDVDTTTNISLFNFRCNIINSHVHKNIMKHTEDYFVGLDIICRKYERSKNFVINTNYTYKITKLGDKYTKIKDEVEDVEYTIPNGVLRNNFKLPYALTLDSVQGLSFGEDEKITIFDCNVPYTDRKYFWTAITRARKLDNVCVFIHSDEEVEKLTQSRIRLYFNNKITSYKTQDNRAVRAFEPADFVTEKWIQSKIEECNNQCKFCKKYMEIYITDATVHSNITVDRIDNSKAHTIKNSQICCLNCNLRKGARF